MNKKTRHIYVVNPGYMAGMTFYTTYEVESTYVENPDVLLDAKSQATQDSQENRLWTQAGVLLREGTRRLAQINPFRRFAKAGATA
jgi:hypothetical protein